MSSDNGDDNKTPEQEWTTKRFWNTWQFRSAAALGALTAAGASSNAPLSRMPANAGATLHLASFGVYFGTNWYTTFVLGITMFNNLPRKTFGRLQSKLFPKYFMVCSFMLVLQVRKQNKTNKATIYYL
jgi:hypothetical protein